MFYAITPEMTLYTEDVDSELEANEQQTLNIKGRTVTSKSPVQPAPLIFTSSVRDDFPSDWVCFCPYLGRRRD